MSMLGFNPDGFVAEDYQPSVLEPLMGSVYYLVVVWALKQRKWPHMPVLKPVAVAHNAFLIVLSVAMFFGGVTSLFARYQDEGAMGLFCSQRPQYKVLDGAMGWWLRVFYWSKYYEFGDTMLLCLKNKATIPLHLYHHVVMAWLCWSACRFGWMEGSVWCVIVNSLIHSAMYTYYLLAALGHSPWWKKYLTTCQIIQFMTGTVYVSIHMLMWCTYGCGSPTWTGRLWAAIAGQAVNTSFIVLFIQFFFRSYGSKKPSKQAAPLPPQTPERVSSADGISSEGRSTSPSSEKRSSAPESPTTAHPNMPAAATYTTSGELHERSGLRMVTLGEVPREAAIDMYKRLQKDAPLFTRLGIQGELLDKYAAHIVDTGRQEPWNLAAVDPATGRVEGLLVMVRNIGAIETSNLPPAVSDHWKIFVKLEEQYRMRSGDCMDDHLACTFLGLMPSFQGKGVSQELNVICADRAAKSGFTRWWSWTLNANIVKMLGKNDGALTYASRVAEYVFKMPPWLSNGIAVPIIHSFGFLPKGCKAYFIPVESLGIQRMVGVAKGLNPMVSANRLVTSVEKERKRMLQKKQKNGAGVHIFGFAATIVVAFSVMVQFL